MRFLFGMNRISLALACGLNAKADACDSCEKETH